ncbi:hypothetical protein CARUB_v10001699mg [Capsella rubella]|uniref:NYN domain-containing protein n=1 Tax=Capsella rubella TaxID=81985 RepID=R0FGB1_9BRAS|nr:uncharacterized protein LOC17884468 [Capsella rubella]EOA21337.1 hypothetical protein CARUB_v10001699mg [Capsella rubella]
MMMMHHPNNAANPEHVKAKTGVWWDINTCPIPDGYDARRVRPSIESALKNLGYSGPVDFTVIGCLEDISENVLRGLSSTGISVKHGRATGLIGGLLRSWQKRNSAPASMMLITDKLEDVSLALVHRQQRLPGYNLLRAYTRKPKYVSVLYTTAEWLWETILATDEMDMDNNQETRIQSSVLRKCSTSTLFLLPQEHPFYCSSCDFATQSLETFTTHLSGGEHKEMEIDNARCRVPNQEGYTYIDKQLQVKENPPTSQPSKKRDRPARARRAA